MLEKLKNAATVAAFSASPNISYDAKQNASFPLGLDATGCVWRAAVADKRRGSVTTVLML